MKSIILSNLLFCGIACWAGASHPTGPDNRPMIQKKVKIYDSRYCLLVQLTLPLPKSDGRIGGEYLIDNTINDTYALSDSRNPIIYMVSYSYKGYFWQGVFGDIAVEISTLHCNSAGCDWKQRDKILVYWKQQIEKYNVDNINNGEADYRWLQPTLESANNIEFVHLVEQSSSGVKIKQYYCIPVNSNLQVMIKFDLIDNSTRPGLVKGDWREGAVKLLNYITNSMQLSDCQ